MKFLLYLENDVSLDTGDGINERESLKALLDLCGDDLIVVLPKPACPEIYSDSRVRYVHPHQVYKPFHYLRFLWSSYREIRKAIRHEDVSAIVHRPGATLFVSYLLSLGPTPVLVKTLSAFNHMKKNEESLLKKLTVRAYELLAPGFFSRCQGGDVVSELYIDWFRDGYGMDTSGLEAIFNGVNTNDFRIMDRDKSRDFLGVTRFEQVVGYIGAIHPMRELDVAIESLTHLPDMPGLGLVLVGGGPERSRLELLAQELGVADRVVFRSPLPYADMPQVINAFDVGLDFTKVTVDSPQGTQIASFSQKISQYAACGVPVIAWDTIDTKFIGSQNLGAILKDSTPRNVAQALRKILGGPNCGQRIREYAESHLSAEQVARKRLALWKRVSERADLSAKAKSNAVSQAA